MGNGNGGGVVGECGKGGLTGFEELSSLMRLNLLIHWVTCIIACEYTVASQEDKEPII